MGCLIQLKISLLRQLPYRESSDEPYSRRISLSVPYYPANLFVILVRFVIF